MGAYIYKWMDDMTDNAMDGQTDRYINIDGQTNRRMILIRFIPIHKFLHRPFKSIFLLYHPNIFHSIIIQNCSDHRTMRVTCQPAFQPYVSQSVLLHTLQL